MVWLILSLSLSLSLSLWEVCLEMCKARYVFYFSSMPNSQHVVQSPEAKYIIPLFGITKLSLSIPIEFLFSLRLMYDLRLWVACYVSQTRSN